MVRIAALETPRHNANARLELLGSLSVPVPYTITLPDNGTYLVEQATVTASVTYGYSLC